MVDDLPGLGRNQAQDHFGQRTLTAAALAHQTYNLPVPDIEVHIMEYLLIMSLSGQRMAAIAAADLLYFQHQLVFVHRSSFPLRVGMEAIRCWV